eukprot:CAMPEP_0177679980 /NCGR_PEP_ID=MMETSP0447-20121125/29918_1 /TAXON_ID=0 /ORGANISM="Stygamoeba regulata, Strain BSH-02190019" /LENGTH=400 /DNA_ID=CAMNT_0019189259 /DNA_START=44 /DNA_END=1242 /DNA_ORIENTATION=-
MQAHAYCANTSENTALFVFDGLADQFAYDERGAPDSEHPVHGSCPVRPVGVHFYRYTQQDVLQLIRFASRRLAPNGAASLWDSLCAHRCLKCSSRPAPQPHAISRSCLLDLVSEHLVRLALPGECSASETLLIEELSGECSASESPHSYELREDLSTAMRVRERRLTVLVLVMGASGSGKTGMACRLAEELGLDHLYSTDQVRAVLRTRCDAVALPELFASTYTAGTVLSDGGSVALSAGNRTRIAYERQSAAVVRALLAPLSVAATRQRESAVVEGVNLSVRAVRALTRALRASGSGSGSGSGSSVVLLPLLLTIADESAHASRFAARCGGSLSEQHNRYVRHLAEIRGLDACLGQEAVSAHIPVLDNGTSFEETLLAAKHHILRSLRKCCASASGSPP